MKASNMKPRRGKATNPPKSSSRAIPAQSEQRVSFAQLYRDYIIAHPNQDSISSQPDQAVQSDGWSLSCQPDEEAMSNQTARRHIDNSHQVNMEESQKADIHTLPTVAAGAVPPSLPPSVEEAYRKKCIELKRRMTEVEESNDGYRLRKARLQRGIRKMRLERAYLLEILGKRMKKNGGSVDGFQGIYDEDSEGSSEAPPTVRPFPHFLTTLSAAS